jgi:hypothetical protein
MSSDLIRHALAFHENPLGQPIDPDQLVVARQQGLALAEIHERAFANE